MDAVESTLLYASSRAVWVFRREIPRLTDRSPQAPYRADASLRPARAMPVRRAARPPSPPSRRRSPRLHGHPGVVHRGVQAAETLHGTCDRRTDGFSISRTGRQRHRLAAFRGDVSDDLAGTVRSGVVGDGDDGRALMSEAPCDGRANASARACDQSDFTTEWSACLGPHGMQSVSRSFTSPRSSRHSPPARRRSSSAPG